MKPRYVKIKPGQLGASLQFLLCLITAGMITFLSRELLSDIYLPFMAAFHEPFLAMILVGFSIFYLLLGLGMINQRFGFFIGIIHGSLGLFTVIFRSVLIREIELSAAFSLLLMSVITGLMIFGWLSSHHSQSKLSLRMLKLSFGVYFLFAFGTYPLSYAVGWWNRSSLELEELEPSKPFQRFHYNVNGIRQSAYYGELHGHSYFSIDARIFGACSPEEYFRYARDIAGLDFCSLTDHDSPNGIANYPELWRYVNSLTEKYNDPGKFVTFNAFEWTSGEGHHEMVRHLAHENKWEFLNDNSVYGHRNIFFPGSKVPVLPFSHNDPNSDTPEELWELMKQYSAIAIPHHPLGGPVPPFKWDHFNPELERLVEIYSTHGNSESVDGRLRIYNPYINEDGTSKHSVQYALGLKHHFGLIGSTDTHTGWGGNGTTNPQNSKPEKMIEFVLEVYDGQAVKGGGLTGVFARELTREGIWEGLIERRTFATTGPRMAVTLEIEGTFMGSVLKVMKGKAIRIKGTAEGTEKLELIELVRNGKIVHSINGSGQKTLDFNWTDENVPKEENYYYLRIVQVDKEMAWSSPVWVINR